MMIIKSNHFVKHLQLHISDVLLAVTYVKMSVRNDWMSERDQNQTLLVATMYFTASCGSLCSLQRFTMWIFPIVEQIRDFFNQAAIGQYCPHTEYCLMFHPSFDHIYNFMYKIQSHLHVSSVGQNIKLTRKDRTTGCNYLNVQFRIKKTRLHIAI